MEDENFIGIYESVISEETCSKITRYFDLKFESDLKNNKNSIRFGENDDHVGKNFTRYDKHLFLEEKNPVYKLLISSVENCFSKYVEKYWVSKNIDVSFREVKLQKTPIKGGFHTWHCEANNIESVDRCIAWMIYLNDIPEGEGETEFLWQKLRVQPKVGTCLIWPAYFTHHHRGNTIFTKEKYIATGWGVYNDVELEEFYVKSEETGFYERK